MRASEQQPHSALHRHLTTKGCLDEASSSTAALSRNDLAAAVSAGARGKGQGMELELLR